MAARDLACKGIGARAIGSLPRLARLAITCRRCGRRNELPAALLIAAAKLDPRTPIGELSGQLRCSICNSKRVTVSL
ncbi:MAG: hypothetical protein JNL66_15855 [Alphaproteobacteria bacterium]|nr:hypothetical protein [Alphaproteobacteria bacterium]